MHGCGCSNESIVLVSLEFEIRAVMGQSYSVSSAEEQPARFPGTTAIVLAGGKSSRFGRDKCLLPVDGRPIIQHVCEILLPHFDQVLVSVSVTGQYDFLDLELITDPVQDRGPMQGIAAGLRASGNERNLVVAGDIPDPNIALAERMLSEIDCSDIVVPRIIGNGFLEPLFAMYRRSLFPVIDEMLEHGIRRIRKLFSGCRTTYIDVPDDQRIRNLNTMEDYLEYLARTRTSPRKEGT